MLVVGGMIGVGKTTLASVIAADLNIDLYTENVDGNDILPCFTQHLKKNSSSNATLSYFSSNFYLALPRY